MTKSTRGCRALVALMVVLVAGAAARAQENPVHWSASTRQAVVKPGQSFKVEMVARMDEGWHFYSVTQPPPPIATRVGLAPNQPAFSPDGKVDSPAPEIIFDQNFGINAEYYSHTATFVIPLKAAAGTPPGKTPIKVQAYFQACNDQMCLPPKTVTMDVAVEIAGGAGASTATAATTSLAPPGASSVTAAAREAPGTSNAAPASPQPVVPPLSAAPSTPAVVPATQAQVPASATAVPSRAAAANGGPAPDASGSLWSFLWLAMTMGAVSLLTPCVFPMVPITVSYFTSQAAGSRKRAVGQAFTYMMGIVLTFTAIGMAMALLLGATSLSRFAASPSVNLLIVAIFIGLALSLLGFYEITIPSGLLSRLDGATRRSEGNRTIGTLLMALTFTLTSFTCTAPFIGTLLVMAAGGDWQWPLAGMLAFATVFALPFFVLALMPQWLVGLPRAGGWMNSVKVMMGFLVIAASTKFIANVDVVWGWGIFTRDVVLAGWVTIALLMMAYILGLFRFQHDSAVKHVGLVRLATALLCGTLAFWLASGLTGKSLGELDALLPLSTGKAVARGTGGAGELTWLTNDYEGALAEARRTNRRVFLDFTGYTCTNCKWMETNMFPRPEVQREFGNYVLVRLYTDGSGEVYERHQQLQQARYKTVAIPYYAIVEADGSPVASFPGLTRDPQKFVAFLRKGQG